MAEDTATTGSLTRPSRRTSVLAIAGILFCRETLVVEGDVAVAVAGVRTCGEECDGGREGSGEKARTIGWAPEIMFRCRLDRSVVS
ncbi:hypothetical protein [Actinoallomurus sp. NPDC050550]|uniref:hypothetical protein n=1 Tax=Actinoallomurus sp. NPDC050550 TaxID=3154937 RepID=UPI0033E532A4